MNTPAAAQDATTVSDTWQAISDYEARHAGVLDESEVAPDYDTQHATIEVTENLNLLINCGLPDDLVEDLDKFQVNTIDELVAMFVDEPSLENWHPSARAEIMSFLMRESLLTRREVDLLVELDEVRTSERRTRHELNETRRLMTDLEHKYAAMKRGVARIDGMVDEFGEIVSITRNDRHGL